MEVCDYMMVNLFLLGQITGGLPIRFKQKEEEEEEKRVSTLVLHSPFLLVHSDSTFIHGNTSMTNEHLYQSILQMKSFPSSKPSIITPF